MKIKIKGSLDHEIIFDNVLETIANENDEKFIKRVESAYYYEASFGLPDIGLLAYRVFFDYFEPSIESIIGKISIPESKIEMDLFQGKSKTPKDQNYNDVMAIRSELEEHVRLTYSIFEMSHIIKVKKILDELKLSNNINLPIIQVW
ncbi:hypothetical protein MRBL20_004988 [Peribacillus frigoritolerans]